MPTCQNHPAIEAEAPCASCGQPYCDACLVQFQGLRLCGRCRDLRLGQMLGHRPQGIQPSTPPTLADHIIPARNPQALIGYYLGVFSLIPCLGNLLGPAALALGILALRARRREPNLPGATHAIVAIVLGSLTTLVYWGAIILMLIGTLARW